MKKKTEKEKLGSRRAEFHARGKSAFCPKRKGKGGPKKPQKKPQKKAPSKKMCEAWVTHDPMLSAGAAAVLVCVTVVVYSGALLTAIAGMVLYTSAGTRGTSRFGRASA